MRYTEDVAVGYSTVKVVAVVGALVAAAVVGTAIFGSLFMGLGDEVEETNSPRQYSQTQQTEFEVQSGEVAVEAEDADEEVGRLKSGLYRFDGELRSEERTENGRQVKYSVEVRVADEEFEGFVDWLYEEYDVTSSEVGYETVDVTGSRNEVEVLLDAMEVYDGMVEHYADQDARRLSTSDVDEVRAVTQERLRVARKLNDLGYDLEEVERRSERPTVEIVFREDVEPSMMPEELGDGVRASVSDGVDAVSDGVTALAAAPLHALALLLLLVRLGLYVLVVGTPLAMAYYALARVHENRI